MSRAISNRRAKYPVSPRQQQSLLRAAERREKGELDARYKRTLLKRYDGEVTPLDQELAEMLIVEIRDSDQTLGKQFGELRRYLYNLEARKGYAALGYKSLNACLKGELGDIRLSQSQLYREAQAAKIEHLIAPDSPIGEIPESVLRELAKVKGDELRKQAWHMAMTAKPEPAHYPTAEQVKKVIEKMFASGIAGARDKRTAQAMAEGKSKNHRAVTAFFSKMTDWYEGLETEQDTETFLDEMTQVKAWIDERIAETLARQQQDTP